MVGIQNTGGGVNLNAFLNKANANPDGNVRMNSAGTEIKAESFFKKAVSWMTNTHPATRQAFSDALSERYGQEVATYALNAMRELRPDIGSDQPLSALEIKVVNSLAAEQVTGNMRTAEPSIARFSPPRGRVESPQPTEISPAAKELARKNATDMLEKIHASNSFSAFVDHKAELLKHLEAALGKLGGNDIMRNLEQATKLDFDKYKTVVNDQLRILDSAAENFAVTSAMLTNSAASKDATELTKAADDAANTAIEARKSAANKIKDAAFATRAAAHAASGNDVENATKMKEKADAANNAADDAKKISAEAAKSATVAAAKAEDARKVAANAKNALTDAEARNPIRPSDPKSKEGENENGW